MTEFVAARVNNEVLSRIAHDDIRSIIKPHPAGSASWEPPYYIKAKSPVPLPAVSGGTVADITEAIIAATYLTHLDIESCCCLVSNLKIVPDIRKLCHANYSLEKAEFLIGYEVSKIKDFHSRIKYDWTYLELYEEASKHMK